MPHPQCPSSSALATGTGDTYRPCMTPERAKAFSVGRHTVRVAEVRDGCWAFTIDDGDASDGFPSASAAWAAGIRAAFILDAWRRINDVA